MMSSPPIDPDADELPVVPRTQRPATTLRQRSASHSQLEIGRAEFFSSPTKITSDSEEGGAAKPRDSPVSDVDVVAPVVLISPDSESDAENDVQPKSKEDAPARPGESQPADATDATFDATDTTTDNSNQRQEGQVGPRKSFSPRKSINHALKASVKLLSGDTDVLEDEEQEFGIGCTVHINVFGKKIKTSERFEMMLLGDSVQFSWRESAPARGGELSQSTKIIVYEADRNFVPLDGGWRSDSTAEPREEAPEGESSFLGGGKDELSEEERQVCKRLERTGFARFLVTGTSCCTPSEQDADDHVKPTLKPKRVTILAVTPGQHFVLKQLGKFLVPVFFGLLVLLGGGLYVREVVKKSTYLDLMLDWGREWWVRKSSSSWVFSLDHVQLSGHDLDGNSEL